MIAVRARLLRAIPVPAAVVRSTVEARDRKVVRYTPAVLGGGTQRPDGQQVVEAEHGVGRLGQGQQRPHRLRAVAAVVLRCRRHQLGDDR